MALQVRGMAHRLNGPAKSVDPMANFRWPGLHRRTIDNQSRSDIGNFFHFDEAIGLQRLACGNQVDDPAAKAQRRRQFHCAIQLDALRMDPPGSKMAPGDGGIFGRHTHMAPPTRIVRRP